MAKRLLIDLTKCRECRTCEVTCLYDGHPVNIGLKSILEMAAFRFTCRHCEDAPCIAVCPAEALERSAEGIVERALNLCVACKSCVAACPFGTLMNQFFDMKQPVCNLCNFDETTSTLSCIDTCPENAISFTDKEPDHAENIFKLNDKVLVKEYAWDVLKES